ncbi:hypothetical protein GKE82_06540 [Conexibacter sp. W3-3-2]|uniref:hypothetical protein n=1 Tax=Conexibacter sp. W3-3-2 TaxID=2675227 RepID=UPI0012B9427C|nr:hypothetical protein [Conexibacter sp. W3-3-2]MTD43969.1 hypothetical protein [Conexibacter sp. W3-3-2]
MSGFLEREVMLAPDLVARAAAALLDDPAQRWMLQQPVRVRRSFVVDVLDRGDDEETRMAWMLGQSDDVRLGYVRDVLRREPGGGDRQAIWMLTQPDAVRRSYVVEVLGRR